MQIPPRGLWGGSGQPTWALTPEWIGREQADGDPDALVLRYLAAFGPASTADVRTWSRLTGLREVVARLKPDLRTFRDEGGRELLDVADGPLPDPATPAPPRFLPQYDNLFLSHADRMRTFDGTGAAWDVPSRSATGALFVDGFYRAPWLLDGETLSPPPLPGARRRRGVRHAARMTPPDLGLIAREWGRIGCLGFGGPPAHIAMLRRLVVDRRAWLDDEEVEHLIATTNLLPGPSSTQLAIFCAWRLRGAAGALIGGLAFVLPGLVVIVALAALFLGTPPRWIAAAGAGAGAVVAAVAVHAGAGLLPRAGAGPRAPGVSAGSPTSSRGPPPRRWSAPGSCWSCSHAARSSWPRPVDRRGSRRTRGPSCSRRRRRPAACSPCAGPR